MSSNPRAAPYQINVGATWASPLHTRLVTKLWTATDGQEAAVRYREGGVHLVVSLRTFRRGFVRNGR